MAEIGLDLQDPTESAGIDIGEKLGHRRLEAALVAHAEHEPRVPAQADQALGIGFRQGQRLLAEHVFAGGRAEADLLVVEGMRRRQDDGVDGGVAEDLGEIGRQGQAALRREGSCGACVGIDRTGDPHHVAAALDHIDHLAAPPPEADHGEIDHGFRSCRHWPCSRRRRRGWRR